MARLKNPHTVPRKAWAQRLKLTTIETIERLAEERKVPKAVIVDEWAEGKVSDDDRVTLSKIIERRMNRGRSALKTETDTALTNGLARDYLPARTGAPILRPKERKKK
jgi:hypothetical protein